MHLRQLNKLGAIALTTTAVTLLPGIGQSQAVRTAYLASGESVTYEGYFWRTKIFMPVAMSTATT